LKTVSAPVGFMPQLDSLRTFAVVLVVIYHWFPTGEGINWLPNGTIGVMIFFVISGFLISRILLESRNRIDEGAATLGGTYRNFFMRRALRIFPLYYLVITTVWVFLPQMQSINPDLQSDIERFPAYYYLYGSNILLHQTGNWADLLSPFWTLGVEEQLYLVWPWVIFLIPRPFLKWSIAGLVVVGVMARLYGYFNGDLDGVLMPANTDAFGLGALWAYIVVEEPDEIQQFVRQLNRRALISVFLFGFLLLQPGDSLAVVLFQRLVISILALWFVVGASRNFGGAIGTVLNNSTLQFIGRISYGIYVFHMLVPGFFMPLLLRIVNRFSHLPQPGYWPYRIISLAVLLVLASASWFFFEKPINELKRRFR
jgi:peptidoglycan/LPS O-acetylase OafA/YrhL